MPDDFHGNQQSLIWTSTKAGALCDVTRDVWLVSRSVQFCRLLEMKSDFLLTIKSSISLVLLLNLITKHPKNIMFTFRKRTIKYLKMQQLCKRENNFYSHYIIPNIKIRVKCINKSMTFKNIQNIIMNCSVPLQKVL